MNKVVILKSELSSRGGIEKYALYIAKAFANRSCDVSILTTGAPPPLEEDGIKLISLGKLWGTSQMKIMQYNKRCREWLKNHPSEIIFGMDRNVHQTHYRAGNGVHAAYLLKRAKDVSLLKRLSFSINPLHRHLLRLERQIYENPSLRLLFTNSEMVRREVLKHYRIDANKVVAIHNGMEWHEMEKDFSIWEKRRKKCHNSSYQFLFVGNGFRRKGLHCCMRALAEFPEKNWRLSVVGKDRKMKYFLSLAKKLGIHDKIAFFGEEKNTRKFYQMADALIIPSFYDPFANVTVEALAMGLYVISSKGNGGHEALTEKNGSIIENIYDPQSFIRSLKRAFLHKKTKQSAKNIRDSVKHLDFSLQLKKIVNATLNAAS